MLNKIFEYTLTYIKHTYIINLIRGYIYKSIIKSKEEELLMFRIGQEEIDAFTRVINSKQLFRIGSKNQEVDNFERELAEKVSVDYALFLTGGTTALITGLMGLGVGPGDEVIVPGYTFMASALAVTAVGAIPVIVEVDDTLSIDPEDIERKISPHTKAIMPVHMLGFPCDMEKIMDIAKRYQWTMPFF